MKKQKIYFSMEHCDNLNVPYFKSGEFYIHLVKVMALRNSWDGPHSELFEKIISEFGLNSELELGRTKVKPETPLRVDVDAPGWYKILSVAGPKKSWRRL